MAASAQMTQTMVRPNHSGWDSAGRYTPHQIQFSGAPCKCGVESALLSQAWKPSSQHAGEKRGVAGLLLGRTERAARAAELQLCAQER